MKRLLYTTSIFALSLLVFVPQAIAEDGRVQIDEHIRALTTKFQAMQNDKDRRIPPQTLQKAHGILLLDRTKAGYVYAYQGGTGVAMLKDQKSGAWGAPAFMKAEEASLGFQVGVQQSFVVALFMDADAAKQLMESQTTFGGEARGTAGDESTGAETGTDEASSSVLVFYSREGVYGGAALKGGSVGPDNQANRRYYERPTTTREILIEKKVKPTNAALELAAAIAAQSRLESKASD